MWQRSAPPGRSSCGPSDRNKQAAVWKRPLSGGNRIGNKQNMSSPSPVTDGRTVWVMTGTGILKAFDFAGKELWARDIPKDYGAFGVQFGYASSPLLHGDALFLQVLHGMHTDDPSTSWHWQDAASRVGTERPTDALLIAGFLQHSGPPATRRQDRDRRHRRRRGHRSRSGQRQGSVAATLDSEPGSTRNLPDHLVAVDCRRADHRSEPVIPLASGRGAWHIRRRMSPGPSTVARMSPRR